MDEEALLNAARHGDVSSMEVVADLYEIRGQLALACMFRLGARGYCLPISAKRFQERFRESGLWLSIGQQVDGCLSDRLVRVAYKELKHAAEEAQRRALITVFCTACGKSHVGERVAMAKFRKCCQASMHERKFCRGCGSKITREEYFSRPFSYSKGWGTFAKCDACGTQHRLPQETLESVCHGY